MSLEDKILKQNIPGRYTSWNQDCDHSESDSDVTHDSRTTKATTEETAPLHDLKSSPIHDQIQHCVASNPCNNSLLDCKNGCAISNLSTEDSDHDIDDEDEFIKNYRLKRFLQLQQTDDWPIYGHMKEVTPIEFAEIIDATDPRVFCVIHLFEHHINNCQRLNVIFQILAEKMKFCRFLSLQATAALQNMDPIGLPSVLIYRNRELIANLTPITYSFQKQSYLTAGTLGTSQPFSIQDVQSLLESYGIVDPQSTDALQNS